MTFGLDRWQWGPRNWKLLLLFRIFQNLGVRQSILESGSTHPELTATADPSLGHLSRMCQQAAGKESGLLAFSVCQRRAPKQIDIRNMFSAEEAATRENYMLRKPGEAPTDNFAHAGKGLQDPLLTLAFNRHLFTYLNPQ